MGADDFLLNVPLNQALFGFGDAVCVPVIRWIAENYLTPLATALHAQTQETKIQRRAVRYGAARKDRQRPATT